MPAFNRLLLGKLINSMNKPALLGPIFDAEAVNLDGAEREGVFLFQGTLLVNFDVETMLRCLKIPIAKLKDKEIASLKEGVTCLKAYW